jgi:hypothetical protein
MSSKPTPLPQLLPFESFFMRLPSSSSLLLASLAVSSSSSSLSALAAPVGDDPAPGPPLPSVPPQGSDDAMAQPNGTPASCTITFLSNTATGYLQASGLVDKLIVTLPLPPDLVNAIPGLIHGILDPLIGKDAPKARETPQTTRAEEADHGRGEHAAPEGSSAAIYYAATYLPARSFHTSSGRASRRACHRP